MQVATLSTEITSQCKGCAFAETGECPAGKSFPGGPLRRVARKRFEPGEEIYKDNETPNTVAIVRSGWAMQSVPMKGGGRQILTFLVTGDVFDQDAVMLTQTPTMFASSALTPTEVCFFSIDEYRALLQGDIRSRRYAKRHIRRHQALMAKHMIDIGRRRAPGRLAGFLLELRQRLSERGLMREEAMPFPFTQEDIADALGLTHAHVNRTLKDLRQTGVIEYSPGSLRILDVAALAPGAIPIA